MPNSFESMPTPTQETKKPEIEQNFAKIRTQYFRRLNHQYDEYIKEETSPEEKEFLKGNKVRFDRMERQLVVLGSNPDKSFKPEEVIDGIYGIAKLKCQDFDNSRDPNVDEGDREEFQSDYEKSRKIFMNAGDQLYPNIDIANIAFSLYRINQLFDTADVPLVDDFRRQEEIQSLLLGNPRKLLEQVDNVIWSLGTAHIHLRYISDNPDREEDNLHKEKKEPIVKAMYILERVREKLQEKISSRSKSEKKFDESSAPPVNKESKNEDNIEQDPLLSLINKAANEEVAYQYKLASEKEGVVQVTPIAWTYDALVNVYNGDIQQVGRRIREFRDFVDHKKTELLASGRDETGASFFASKEAFKQLTSKEIQALDEVIAAEVRKQKRRTGGSAFHTSRELLFSRFLSAACSV